MKFSIRELVSYAVSLSLLAVTITVWATEKFATKEELRGSEDTLTIRVIKLEELGLKIAQDTAFIRGKLEQKDRK